MHKQITRALWRYICCTESQHPTEKVQLLCTFLLDASFVHCHPFCHHPYSIVPSSCHKQLPSEGCCYDFPSFSLAIITFFHHQRLNWLISSAQPGRKAHRNTRKRLFKGVRLNVHTEICTYVPGSNDIANMKVSAHRISASAETWTHLMKHSNTIT